jgi:riboflavin kinase / FMN adenylyltransferase
MQVHFGLDSFQAEWPACVACIGTFDGVHLGHQAVIGEAVSQAKPLELPCVLITFDRHPAALLHPESCPLAVAPLNVNLREFEKLGVAVAVILAFDRPLSETSADTFLREILKERLFAQKLVVGHDFAFGKDRQGTPEWLSSRIYTVVVPPFVLEGKRVSSSVIRTAISEGRVEEVATLLGRPFEITGVVVAGQKLGRTLGYPTANLARSTKTALPENGIYAGKCDTPFGSFPAAISIGIRPAVGGGKRTVEAYLLNYPGHSLYGCSISIAFERRLREERDFPSIDALKAQIGLDVEEVRSVIKI